MPDVAGWASRRVPNPSVRSTQIICSLRASGAVAVATAPKSGVACRRKGSLRFGLASRQHVDVGRERSANNSRKGWRPPIRRDCMTPRLMPWSLPPSRLVCRPLVRPARSSTSSTIWSGKRTRTNSIHGSRTSKSSLVSSFATGVPRTALLCARQSHPCSSGQVEGQITKLKLVKRQIYGRAKIDVLEARSLGAAWPAKRHRICVRAANCSATICAFSSSRQRFRPRQRTIQYAATTFPFVVRMALHCEPPRRR
ncbi:hypothetical protein ABIA96_007426 [Bradyrhizobium sp. LB11.1]